MRIAVRSADAVRNVRLYIDGRLLATDYRDPYVFTYVASLCSLGAVQDTGIGPGLFSPSDWATRTSAQLFTGQTPCSLEVDTVDLPRTGGQPG